MVDDRLPGATRTPVPADPGAGHEREDFIQFYQEQMSKLVLFVCAGTGAHVEEAWDAAQIAMTEAWRQWSDIVVPRAFVRTVAVRAYYRAMPNPRFTTGNPVPDQVDGALTPDQIVELTESTAELSVQLDGLTVDQRLAFTLAIDGYRTNEIAAIVVKSEDAVRKNIARAKAAIAKKIAGRSSAR